MQIYTRTGDKGTTKIIGGASLPKDDTQVEAYGTVDELNSLLGTVIASMGASTDSDEILKQLKEEFTTIQHYLFDCGNDLATPAQSDKYPYRLTKASIEWLEERIDTYAPIPKAVESFILPGGTYSAALIHQARTVARRCERRIVSLQARQVINDQVLVFINRLSDYFFATARLVNHQAQVEDILYERSGRVFHLDINKDDLTDLSD